MTVAYTEQHLAIGFSVDGTPPLIGLPDVLEPVPMDEPVTIAGTSEPGATLVVGGVPIETRDGSFVLELEEPPAGPVSVLAIDRREYKYFQHDYPNCVSENSRRSRKRSCLGS